MTKNNLFFLISKFVRKILFGTPERNDHLKKFFVKSVFRLNFVGQSFVVKVIGQNLANETVDEKYQTISRFLSRNVPFRQKSVFRQKW